MKNLKLRGANNVRDFGGIVNREGKTVRYGCFLRGNALNKLKKSDVRVLREQYRLSSVIDLRTAQEAAEKPDISMEGVINYPIPVFSEATAGITRERSVNSLEILDRVPEFTELYEHMVRDEYSRKQLSRVFELILNKPDGEGMLWHCTQGKDRCGFVSALFLTLLDVDEETVFEDYLFTNTASSFDEKKYCFLVYLFTRDRERVAKVKRIYTADRAYLDAAFSAARELYGSVDGFLREGLGISDDDKAAFKEKYLE